MTKAEVSAVLTGDTSDQCPWHGALKTRLNLVAVWKYVDDIVPGIRVLHAAGAVAILTGLTAQQVAELRFGIDS
jgi:hypothetical protein